MLLRMGELDAMVCEVSALVTVSEEPLYHARPQLPVDADQSMIISAQAEITAGTLSETVGDCGLDGGKTITCCCELVWLLSAISMPLTTADPTAASDMPALKAAVKLSLDDQVQPIRILLSTAISVEQTNDAPGTADGTALDIITVNPDASSRNLASTIRVAVGAEVGTLELGATEGARLGDSLGDLDGPWLG